MAKLNDIKNTRVNYLQYVYEHHIKHIMMNGTEMILQKKMTEAAKKSYEDSSILEEYLKDVRKKEKVIAEQFKDDLYDSFIFIERSGDKVTLYSSKTDKIYHVYLIDLDDKLMLSTLNKFNQIESVLCHIDHKYYLDIASYLPDKQKTLYNRYKYEDRVNQLMK